ncbi:MAG: hypothetical protein ABSH08_05745 [Tepidisphaeraceae bacterium]|jgi:hypothetical protein
MKDRLTQDEKRLLSRIIAGCRWPQQTDISLDYNAAWVGQQVGLTESQTKSVVESLVRRGLLHARELEGVILVHPTKAALDRGRTAKNPALQVLKELFQLFRPRT